MILSLLFIGLRWDGSLFQRVLFQFQFIQYYVHKLKLIELRGKVEVNFVKCFGAFIPVILYRSYHHALGIYSVIT